MEQGEQGQYNKLPEPHRIRSSVFYYFVIQFNWVWNVVNTIALIIIQAMKIYQFPMSKVGYEFSMCAPFLLFVLEWIKLEIAKPGNRSEYPIYLFISLVFLIGCVVMDIYFIVLQPYLWRGEIVFHIISLVFEAVVFLFTILMCIIFLAKKK